MSNLVINITIGNWYLVRDKPTKITPANVVWPFRDGCSPMPLTDNILESHGWWHDGQRCIWENDGIELPLEDGADGNKFWWKAGDNLVVPINYVHQLQDAMRLAMADKVIEL